MRQGIEFTYGLDNTHFHTNYGQETFISCFLLEALTTAWKHAENFLGSQMGVQLWGLVIYSISDDSRKSSSRRTSSGCTYSFMFHAWLPKFSWDKRTPLLWLHKSPRGGVGNSSWKATSLDHTSNYFMRKTTQAEKNNKNRGSIFFFMKSGLAILVSGFGLAAKLLSAVCNLNVQSYTQSLGHSSGNGAASMRKRERVK